MPGVLNSNFDFNREVGKMAFVMPPDLMTLVEDVNNNAECITDNILDSFQILFSGSIADFADSDSDLPDNERPMDLIKYLDNPDFDVGLKLHEIKCEDGCNNCSESPNKYHKYRVSERQDPFMGMGGAANINNGNGGPSGQLSPIDYDSDTDGHLRQKIKDIKTFSAWNTPKKEAEEEPDFMLARGSTTWQHGLFDGDESSDNVTVTFPETPSSTESETVAGDDSDVDIETVTDAPRSIGSCGFLTSESSPEGSPLTSGHLSSRHLNKLKSGSLFTILSKSAATNGRISAQSSALLTAQDVSSSSPFTDNLMAIRSDLLGQKRKHSKERKFQCRIQSQSSYQHMLPASNSVNFHDYAMSPGACTYSSSSSQSSIETGRPTVMSKRIYKRKQFTLDTSDKEKQHHHNQLERNRRQKLADLFVDLRDEVPKIASQAKASKVLILNEATVHIRDLQRRQRQQEDDISIEIRRKEMLKTQLRNLEARISRNK